jgi:myosin heavy subunit
MNNRRVSSYSNIVPGEIIDKEAFTYTCQLLGLNARRLESCMLYRSRTILKEVTLNPEPLISCKSTRDSMMKTLYENLFQWIITMLNLTLKDEQAGGAND